MEIAFLNKGCKEMRISCARGRKVEKKYSEAFFLSIPQNFYTKHFIKKNMSRKAKVSFPGLIFFLIFVILLCSEGNLSKQCTNDLTELPKLTVIVAFL